MPNRIIKEKCRTSRSLDRLSDGAERFFWRLITVADDFGRFEADPAVLASTTFPLRNGKLKIATVSGWLQELIACEHVRAYVSKGTRYGQFVNWEAHQGKPRAKISKFPAPTDNEENQHDSNCEQMRANAPVFVSESDIRIRDSYSRTCEQMHADGADTAAPPTTPTGVGLNEESGPKKKSGKPRGHRTVFPDGWDVEPWMVELCEGYGLKPYAEFRDFRNHHVAKGSLFASWPHAFRTWVSKSVSFRDQRRA